MVCPFRHRLIRLNAYIQEPPVQVSVIYAMVPIIGHIATLQICV